MNHRRARDKFDRYMIFSAVGGVLLTITACAGPSGGDTTVEEAAAPSAESVPTVEVGTCLNPPTVTLEALLEPAIVDCAAAHTAEVYALTELPADLQVTDPAQVDEAWFDRAWSAVECPDADAENGLRTYIGYKGDLHLGLIYGLTFPSAEEIAGGANEVACTLIASGSADGNAVLRSTTGSLKGAVTDDFTVVRDWAACGETHAEESWELEPCNPESEQWALVKTHEKPEAAFPGEAQVEQVARDACQAVADDYGWPEAEWWVYWPAAGENWAESGNDWACWVKYSHLRS